MAEHFAPFLEAEYESGYVLREDVFDASPYDAGRNIFHAILHKRPEQFHGPMVELRLVFPDKTFTIDWRVVPENARPIRFKRMANTWVDGVEQGKTMTGVDFGYQWRDENGRKQQEVMHFGDAGIETMPDIDEVHEQTAGAAPPATE